MIERKKHHIFNTIDS